MKEKKVFTTSCYMVVNDKDHAKALINELTSIGDRSLLTVPDDILYPCICAVSTIFISLGCPLCDLVFAGFIDCKDDEKRFLKLASFTCSLKKQNARIMNEIGGLKYWRRIQGFRFNQLGTGQKSNPIKLNKRGFKTIKS
jgi:hypothetical protein